METLEILFNEILITSNFCEYLNLTGIKLVLRRKDQLKKDLTRLIDLLLPWLVYF